MPLSGTRTYVGFGFGAIQAGLFLYEAYQAGAFGRLVVAEVAPDVVAAVRASNGTFGVNIAHADGIERATIGPVTLENPAVEADRDRLIDAIAHADEIGTAVPSVAYYTSEQPGSLHRVLAAGLRRKAAEDLPRAVVYAAENNNHAAEILEAQVMESIPEDERGGVRAKVRFLNTVIGKMSGVVGSAEEIAQRGLLPATPDGERAYLVEAFNRILISRVDFADPFTRGITVFEEKADLLPFEEAKLYGHNATHALLAYLAAAREQTLIADLRALPDVMAFARAAFIEESGLALIRKYPLTDPLFTPEGYAAYADDLLERMTNPYLGDTVERVGRDPARKVGWDDRLIGTMRLALSMGITPRRYALGAAAALAVMYPRMLREAVPADKLLLDLWDGAVPPSDERDAVLGLVLDGAQALRAWLNEDRALEG